MRLWKYSTSRNRHIPNKEHNNEKPKNIQEAIKLRNYLRRQFQRIPNLHTKTKLNEQKDIVRTLIQTQNEYLWEKRINRARDTKQNVWKAIKTQKEQNHS